MEISMYVDRYKQARFNFFKWRHELEFIQKFTLAFAFACLTGLMALYVRVYLPWTPIPITGQTFAVLLSAIVLGRWGGVSQLMYVGLGVAGVPWFAGADIFYTGGYLVGFILAAFFLGSYTDNYVRSRNFSRMLPLMLIANFVIIYICGLAWLYYAFYSTGLSFSFTEFMAIGATPYIAGDLLKIFAATSVGKLVTPKKAFGNELDA